MDKLKDSLFQLKNSKFEIEPAHHKKRKLRHAQFNEYNGFNNVPKRKVSSTKEGMFRGLTFCFPRHHPTLHPPPDKMFNLARGIESQSGRLIDIESDLLMPAVDYVLADHRIPLSQLKQRLAGKVIYVEVIDYKWVQDSLRRFSLQNVDNYKLVDLKRSHEQLQAEEYQIMDISSVKSGEDFFSEIKSAKDQQNQQQSDDGTEQMLQPDREDDSDQSIIVTQTVQGQSCKQESVRSDQTEEMQPEDNQKTQNLQESNVSKYQAKKKIKPALGSHKFEINNQICAKLLQMQQIYEQKKDSRSCAYLRAIAAIRNLNEPIRSGRQLANISGVGRKTIEKVEQFLRTGSISRVDKRVGLQKEDPYHELLRITGIGPSKAEELHHKGIRSIEQLRKHPQLLSKTQLIGLKYLHEFEDRIPRDKVTKLLEYVKQTWYYLVRANNKHFVEAVGSYRRGKETCGDIDILITRKDGKYQRGMLARLVSQLTARGFLTDHLNQPRIQTDDQHSVQYMGVCQLEGPQHHRIDIKYYPRNQYAFALLYFTGSPLFNRQMRLAANQQGLMLGDHSLRRVERKKTVPRRNSQPPQCLTERDVFNVLQMPYRTPEQRQV